jgi:hypothetical protein
MTTITTKTKTTANPLGTPFRCIQNKGGAQMTAIKTDNKNGTRIALAARIPAIMITKQAAVIKKLETPDLLFFSFTTSPRLVTGSLKINRTHLLHGQDWYREKNRITRKKLDFNGNGHHFGSGTWMALFPACGGLPLERTPSLVSRQVDEVGMSSLPSHRVPLQGRIGLQLESFIVEMVCLT